MLPPPQPLAVFSRADLSHSRRLHLAPSASGSQPPLTETPSKSTCLLPPAELQTILPEMCVKGHSQLCMGSSYLGCAATAGGAMVQSEAAGRLHQRNRSPSASSLLGRLRGAEGSCGHSLGPYRLSCGGLSSQQTALASQRAHQALTPILERGQLISFLEILEAPLRLERLSCRSLTHKLSALSQIHTEMSLSLVRL